MNLTPAMRQYLDIKEQYKDCIIFFRMGDFYEMFFDDAVTGAKVLEITLTSRNRDKENSVPLCGIPYHAASTYIARLIRHGYKVAICEQMEDPREAKGIVKREVVRVVTPGLVLDSDNLSEKENNYLAGLFFDEGTYGLAFLDISTGEFRVTETGDSEIYRSEIAGLDFREVVLCEDEKAGPVLPVQSFRDDNCLINYVAREYFEHEKSLELLQACFSDEALSLIDVSRHPVMAAAAGAVLRYVEETQKGGLEHLNSIQWYSMKSHLVLDDTARKNLELFATLQDNRKVGSLLHAIDQTVTAMGGRRLKRWLNYPLVDTLHIRERLAAVSEIKQHHQMRQSLRDALSTVYDIERLGSRISMGIANGRDLIALKKSIEAIPAIKDAIIPLESDLMKDIARNIDEMPDIAGHIAASLVEDPPVTIRDGHLIRKGYDGELDELIALSTDGKRGIAALEDREREKTGITTLKVGFNNVFGYYIEVTKAHSHAVPPDYVRKQTLVNAERYVNEELKQFESKVLNAEEGRKKREYELFVEIRENVGAQIGRIQATASRIADLDALVSLAEIAERYNYTCPKVTEGDVIDIREGRHPVVERMNPNGGFVPNDTFLNCSDSRFLTITGPNMAGKSTYIRQVALIVLMAHMGSFVPAAEAEIGVVDRIFTRVGAADSLAKGQSTFMVEMTEVANILKNASPKSLILLDEVGRGTSTFDGLSIAWAVTEHIHDSEHLGSRTMFATHYHELTDLARTREGVKNFSIAVKEWGEEIIFLRKIVEGGTNRSYGIQVARLAGVPRDVIVRAREILENLESGELDEVGMPKIARGTRNAVQHQEQQMSLFVDDEQHIIRELRHIDSMNITPLEALQKINEWKQRIR